jgi:MFS family permease
VASAIINNNAVPAMNKILQGKNLNIEKMKNNVSAIQLMAFALGQIIGPMAASMLTEYVGFRGGCLIFAMFVSCIGIVKFIAAFVYKDKSGDLIMY